MLTVRSSVGVTILAVSLVGCGAEQLTRDEAEALFAGAMAKSNVIRSLPDTVDVGCLGGGEWEVAGTTASRWEPEPGLEWEWVVNHVIRPRACGVWSEGLRFTVDGDPELRVDRILTWVGVDLTGLTGTVSGGIGWLVDQRQGDCPIDLAIEVEVGESGIYGILTGLLCGHDVRLDAEPVVDLSWRTGR